MLNRLDTINRTSGEIIAGDLTQRVPLTGSGVNSTCCRKISIAWTVSSG
jgi:hypothetical protein